MITPNTPEKGNKRDCRILIKVSNLLMRALVFTGWSTKRSTTLPVQKQFLFVSLRTLLTQSPKNVFLKPAGIAMGRKVAAKADW